MSDTVTTITTLNRALTRIDDCLSDDSADRQYCLEAIDVELTGLRDFLERRPEVPADPDPWDLGELPDSPALPWNEANVS